MKPPAPKVWEIWDVEWPHDDGTSKRRPALCLSDKPTAEGEYFFLKISSVLHPDPSVYEVNQFDPIFKTTGLRKKSYFYPNQIKKISAIYLYRGFLPALAALVIEERLKASGRTLHSLAQTDSRTK